MKSFDRALEEELYAKVRKLRRAGGQREAEGLSAPHKPLFLLILLSEVDRTGTNRFDYPVLRKTFDELWPRFGWRTKSGKSAVDYPYRHLNSSGFWQLADERGVIPASELAKTTDSRLRQQAPFGRFSDESWALIRRPDVRSRLVAEILETYFPEAQREELTDALRLGAIEESDPVAALRETVLVTRRNSVEQARFRLEVLRAYEGKCAVCGFSPRGARAPSAIDAAHIWPVTYEGPSKVENALALCKIHHWALDSGAIGLTADRVVLVSSRVVDGETMNTFLTEFSGRPVCPPLPSFAAPAEKWMKRHRENLFVGPGL